MTESIQEILDISQEEAAEVIVAISKVRRFGLSGIDPRLAFPKTNQQHLEEEIGDLMAMISLMVKSDLIRLDEIDRSAERKLEKLSKWSKVDKSLLGVI